MSISTLVSRVAALASSLGIDSTVLQAVEAQLPGQLAADLTVNLEASWKTLTAMVPALLTIEAKLSTVDGQAATTPGVLERMAVQIALDGFAHGVPEVIWEALEVLVERVLAAEASLDGGHAKRDGGNLTDGGLAHAGMLSPIAVDVLQDLVIQGLAQVARSHGRAVRLPGSTPPLDLEEVDATMPRDLPPPIEAPPEYRRPPVVELSAKFIAKLRQEYTRSGDGRTRRIGQLEDVLAWLDSLQPGPVRPRPEA